MSRRNILLLSMSTLRKEKLSLSSYHYEGTEGSFDCEGYSQLEPVPKLLIHHLLPCQEHLDRIIILATPKTKEPQQIVLAETGIEKELSAVDFFEERMNEYSSEQGTQIGCYSVVELDIAQPSEGIKEAVNLLRDEYRTEEKPALYLDIHGGLRDQQLILEAILSLLRIEGIQPEKTYSVEMPGTDAPKDEPAVIKKLKDSADVFGFVSGMTEFISYGRADGLAAYLQEYNDLITVIQEIADAIQMCDINTFEKNLDKIPAVIEGQKEEKGFLGIFIDNIKNDYGDDLLNPTKRDALALLRWCERKKFYQQALTIIESKMPEYICEKFVAIDLNGEVVVHVQDDREKDTRQPAIQGVEKAKEDWQNPINYVLERCVRSTAVKKNTKTDQRFYMKLDAGDSKEQYWKLKKALWHNKCGKGGEYQAIVCWTEDGARCSETVRIRCQDKLRKDQDKLNVFLQLHMSLKNQRNQVNHASEKDEREPADHLFNAIHAYIDMADYFTRIVDKR